MKVFAMAVGVLGAGIWLDRFQAAREMPVSAGNVERVATPISHRCDRAGRVDDQSSLPSAVLGDLSPVATVKTPALKPPQLIAHARHPRTRVGFGSMPAAKRYAWL